MLSIGMVSIHSTCSSKSLINMSNRTSQGLHSEESLDTALMPGFSRPQTHQSILSSSPHFLNTKMLLKALFQLYCIRYFLSCLQEYHETLGKCLDEPGLKCVVSPFGADQR